MSDEFEQYSEQCYTLEAEQVYNVNTERPGKIYFANLSMSETGLKFKNVKFQIDTDTKIQTLRFRDPLTYYTLKATVSHCTPLVK